jgi:hypothetical protein
MLTVSRVGELRDLLLATIGDERTVEIEIPDGDDIDVAGVQILLAAQKSARARNDARVGITASGETTEWLHSAGLRINERQVRPLHA